MTKRNKMIRDQRRFFIWNHQAINRQFWKLVNEPNYLETVLQRTDRIHGFRNDCSA